MHILAAHTLVGIGKVPLLLRPEAIISGYFTIYFLKSLIVRGIFLNPGERTTIAAKYPRHRCPTGASGKRI